MEQRRKRGCWVVRIGRQLNGADIWVFVEDFRPSRAAVSGAEDAAFCVRTIRMAQGCYEHHSGILRVNQYASDMLRVAQPNVAPCLSAVGGFVHTIAVGEVRTKVCFASACINNVGIRWSNRQRTDGANGLPVEDWFPGHAAVRCLPHTAADRAEIINMRRTFNAADRDAASATERANHPPA